MDIKRYTWYTLVHFCFWQSVPTKHNNNKGLGYWYTFTLNIPTSNPLYYIYVEVKTDIKSVKVCVDRIKY